MALLALLSLALLSLSCWSSSSAELLQSFKEEVGSNISTTNAGVITYPLINIHSDASPFRLSDSTMIEPHNRVAEERHPSPTSIISAKGKP
ncbi:hypothetical protein SUGI_0804120 [Cryptomeria japonica]|nr:hypothetical protein SUGI_0804120 [Cryptomeria japonica]